MKTTLILIIAFLVSGCIPDVEYEVIIPELPCIDGWQYDHVGQPMVNPDTGAQYRCSTAEED